MATYTVEQQVQQIYIGLLGRAADKPGLEYWVNEIDTGILSIEELRANIVNEQPEYAAGLGSLSRAQVVAELYQNLFERAPEPAGLEYWVNGGGATVNIDQLVLAMVDGAGAGDRLVMENKTEAATYYTVQAGEDFTRDAANAAVENVDSTRASVEASKAATDAGTQASGETFTLTTGVDELTGTANNDTFNGSVNVTGTADNSTLTALDSIDGGAGTDTFKVSVSETQAVGDVQNKLDAVSLSNIETINLQSAVALTADTSGFSGVNDVNITNVTTGATSITAAADQNVTLSDKAVGAAVGITDGNNVNVSLTGIAAAADVVTVSGAAGDVAVSVAGEAYKAADAANTLSAVNVTGGKTISVTQSAGDVSNGATDTTNLGNGITQGDITIDADATTSTVTSKQDAAVTAKNAAPTTGGATEVASVQFEALTAGETLIMGGLTFTAAVNMTAEEAAATFANLAKNAATSVGTNSTLAGDTQSGGTTAQGTYTGNFSGWTSGAVSGDTVVFTNIAANTAVTDLANTGTGSATVTTTTQGKANDAGISGGKAGIAAGVVDITNGAALTSVTVDGFSATGSNINGANTALTTLSLSNGGEFTVSNAASELALTLEGINGAYTQTAGATTLNLESVGDNTADLAIANTETLNVSGTGDVTATTSTLTGLKTLNVTGTAGINLGTSAAAALTSVNTTGTTGAVTVGFDGTKATYTGGSGVDNATVTNAGTAITKAIDLGAGDDTLTLGGGSVVVPTVALNGGAGTDTLSTDAASLVNLGGSTAFAAKLNGFEQLAITGATGAQSINVENLGFSNVNLKGSAGTTTLTNFANGDNLVIDAAVTTGVVATVKDDTTGLTDVLNVEVSNDSSITVTELTADKIETVNLTATDVFVDSNGNGLDNNDAVHTMDFNSSEATTLNIDGTAGLNLTLDAATTKLNTIDASGMTDGGLNVSANGSVAMSITGGAGDDVLSASTGTTAKADTIVGGAGDDQLVAGTNGATLTGGAGNDLFLLTSELTGTVAVGTKESNTYSTITDFGAGDRLQLEYVDAAGAKAVVTGFDKLGANLNEGTSTFQNFADAAILEAGLGDAVWFEFGGDAYVVVDSSDGTGSTDADSASFTNGIDSVIKLTGVDMDAASFNSDYGTVEIA